VRRIAAALLAAATVAGCGGSGLGSPVALRRRATDICIDAPHLRPPSDPTVVTQLTAFVSHGIRNLEGEITQLHRLSAGSGEVGAVYGAALRALGAQVSTLHAALAAINRGQDPALAFRALGQQLRPLEKQADNAWGALQIPACLEPS
jgi:hypothetical protein